MYPREARELQQANELRLHCSEGGKKAKKPRLGGGARKNLEEIRKMEHLWAGVVGPTLASIMFIWAMAHKYLPYNFESYVSKYVTTLFTAVYPYIEIKINEYTGDRLQRSEAYAAIQAYLMGTTAQRARRLKADLGKGSTNLVVSMDDNEQVTDEFRDVKLWWTASSTASRTPAFSFYPTEEVRRFYRLSFHRRHRKMIMDHYLSHVLEEGKKISIRSRQRKLYMNNRTSDGRFGRVWSHVVFEHPATFQSLAMEADKKHRIMQDLVTFSNAKEYYARIGKAWKRGYLLYGPPGTGKSTMISAMANFLDYDVYDLELTAVKDNTELRKLLIETTSKSIIVIEDIDCSLDLSGKREKKSPSKGKEDEKEEEEKKRPDAEKEDNSSSKVTLSGLLNFIDGLWSACGGERILVFTTNYVEKLDPALIRRGRMDMHIQMSYCSFEGFKVLANNYLDLDSHPSFEKIQQLLQEANMTPADVAENLMPKSSILTPEENVEACLEELIQDLQKIKEEAVQKAREAEVLSQASSKQEELQKDQEGEVGSQDSSRREEPMAAAAAAAAAAAEKRDAVQE
ncbi:hypothetical protein ACLOJK_021029 [Asimina triloba]